MFTVPELEQALRATGGVEVSIGEVTTWGHLNHTPSVAFGAPGATSTQAGGSVGPVSPVLTVPAQPYPALLPGAVVIVDGQGRSVRAYKPTEGDGALLDILLAERTHLLTIYHPHAAAVASSGRRRTGWTEVAADVPATGGPEAGSVDPQTDGLTVRSRWVFFVPAGTPVQEGDGVVLSSPAGVRRFRVEALEDGGGAWDTRLTLETTQEAIP